MKIRKNGKVVNLTESDLQRIVKRTLNEDVGNMPQMCKEGELSKIKDLFTSDVDIPIKVETGSSYGITATGNIGREILVITDGTGRIINNKDNICFCKKENWG